MLSIMLYTLIFFIYGTPCGKKDEIKTKNRFNVLKPPFVSAELLNVVFLSGPALVKRLRVNHDGSHLD